MSTGRPRGYGYRYISSATTTAVKATSGVLHSIVVGETAAGAITVNDNIGTVAVLKASIAEGSYILDVWCSGKIEVVTAAASKLTVSYD